MFSDVLSCIDTNTLSQTATNKIETAVCLFVSLFPETAVSGLKASTFSFSVGTWEDTSKLSAIVSSFKTTFFNGLSKQLICP